jgi:F-type H+-transporting ATPase subunit b
VPVSALRTSGWAFVLAVLPVAAHAAGMPQFDVTTFPSQIFWLVVSFALLYLLMSRLVLPRISKTIEARETKIQGDLTAAQAANDAARVAAEKQAKALAEARASAHSTVHAAADAAAHETSASLHKVGDRLAGEITAAEGRIDAQKAQALSGLTTLSTEIATSILGKLVGSVDNGKVADKVAQAVQATGKGK